MYVGVHTPPRGERHPISRAKRLNHKQPLSLSCGETCLKSTFLKDGSKSYHTPLSHIGEGHLENGTHMHNALHHDDDDGLRAKEGVTQFFSCLVVAQPFESLFFLSGTDIHWATINGAHIFISWQRFFFRLSS